MKLPILSKNVFKNPVTYSDNIKHTAPDPFILSYCGVYYCYATHEDGVQVSLSTNLVDWEHKGFAYVEKKRKNFWAPAVCYENGTFYMYVSNEPSNASHEHEQFLRLATSATPLGPFKYEETLFNKFSIDAHPVKTKDGYYLYYCVNDITATQDEYSGTCILVDKLGRDFKPVNTPKIAILPSLEQEIFAKNRFNDGRDWYTIEGACLWKKKGVNYLLYSANNYTHENYFVGVTCAEDDSELLKAEWKKQPNNYTWQPLLKRNDFVVGTGHNTIAKAPNLVDDYIVYHGRSALTPINESVEERDMRIDRLLYNGKKMFVAGPTHELQEKPKNAHVTIFDKHIDSDEFALDFPYNYFIAQIWWSSNYSPDGTRYGFKIYLEDGSAIILEWHSGLQKVKLIKQDKNITLILNEFELSSDYNHFVAHKVNILNNLGKMCIELDDITILTHEFSGKAKSISIISKYSALTLHSFAATQHCEMESENLIKLSSFYEIAYPSIITTNGLRTVGKSEILLKAKQDVLLNSEQEFVLCKTSDECRITFTNSLGNVVLDTMFTEDLLTIKIVSSDVMLYAIIGEKLIEFDKKINISELQISLSGCSILCYEATGL